MFLGASNNLSNLILEESKPHIGIMIEMVRIDLQAKSFSFFQRLW